MLKSELIKALVDDISFYGDGQVRVSVFGNNDTVTLKVCGFDRIGEHGDGFEIECDIESTFSNVIKFKEKILNIDDWG